MHRLYSYIRYFYQCIVYVLEEEKSFLEAVILIGFKKQYYWCSRSTQHPSLFSNYSFARWPNFKLPAQTYTFLRIFSGLQNSFPKLSQPRVPEN